MSQNAFIHKNCVIKDQHYFLIAMIASFHWMMKRVKEKLITTKNELGHFFERDIIVTYLASSKTLRFIEHHLCSGS
jgi:hypothetical protein